MRARPAKRTLVVAVLAGLAVSVGLGLHFRDRVRRFAQIPALRNVPSLCIDGAELYCRKLQACGALDGAQQDACVERHALDCDADIGGRLRAGILREDDEAREECFEALEKAQCDAVAFVAGDDEQDVFELTDRCEKEEMLRPQSGIGAPCARVTDCVAGFCPLGEPGCHVCKALVRVGEPCVPNVLECDLKDAFCSAPDAGARCAAKREHGAPCHSAEECRSGLCRASSDGSRTCADAAEAHSCKDARDCAPGAFCRSGVCEGKKKTGEPCTPYPLDNPCADGEATCVEGTCAVRPFSVAAGGACGAFTDCGSGLYCKERIPGRGGTCATQAKLGEDCTSGGFGLCPLGSRCVDGRCRALSRAGERCGGLFQCLAELDCVPDTGALGFDGGARCVAPSGPGQPCGGYQRCRRGFCADAGMCAPLSPPGTACRFDTECASFTCEKTFDGGAARCAAPCG